MRNILVATPVEYGSRTGAAFQLRNLVEDLKLSNFDIHVLQFTTLRWGHPPSEAECQTFVATDLARIAPRIVVAHYTWMAHLFDYIPNYVLKIVLVPDLRIRSVLSLERLGLRDEVGWSEEKEGNLLRKAHLIVVYNDGDQMVCSRLAPGVRSLRIGLSLPVTKRESADEIPGRCIYVASNVAENRHVAQWLTSHVWPLVLSALPSASLDVCMGNVDDLEDHYARAQVALVPHIMPGGIKIKFVEALARGLPIIASSCVVDGFSETAGKCVRVPDESAHDFAQAIVTVLKDHELRHQMSKNAIEVANLRMSPNAAYGRFKQYLVDMLATQLTSSS